jgi:hypothetical protein
VRRLLAALFLVLAFPAIAAPAENAGRLRVVAWASKTAKAGLPPGDAVSGGTYCIPAAPRRLYAFVRFTGMRDKVPSSATWLFNKRKVFVFKFRWEDGDIGRTAFNLYRTKGGLAEGAYGIEIRSGGQLLGTGSVQLKFGAC